MTLKIEKSEIDFKFDFYDLGSEIPREQSTVQFWFKLGNKEFYNAANTRTYTEIPIFEIVERDSRNSYWAIFLVDQFTNIGGERRNVRELVISPYGRSRTVNSDELSVIFDNFTEDNEDESGWWHISCSMWAQNNVDCVLYNNKGSSFKRSSLERVYM